MANTDIKTRTHLLFITAIITGMWLMESSDLSLAQSADGTTAKSNLNLQAPVENLARPIDSLSEQLANSLDAGDAYMTPTGTRALYRLAGAVAVKLEDDVDNATVFSELMASTGPLSGYSLDAERGSGIFVLKAPADERVRQLSNHAGLRQAITSVRQVPAVRWANPVFVEPDSGLWAIATEEIIVQLNGGADPAAVFGSADVRRLPATKRQFILTMPGATAEQILAEVNNLTANPDVKWAEPNFLAQGLLRTPNDAYYNQQWHHNNTGQGGGTSGADLDSEAAWGATTGSSGIVVAILDTGTQTDHPDLSANLFVNSGEIAGNELDDDENGYQDDITGWDFYTGWSPGNNDPNPKVGYDKHGTATAGVAVARGDNGIGVAGAAYTSKLLPIRVGQQTDNLGSYSYFYDGMAAAIRYAGGIDDTGEYLWRGADILSMSISISYSYAIDQALTNSANNGRNGKGCPIFVATGNSASAWTKFTLSGFPPGTYTFRWEYEKNASGTSGDDAVWLDDVTFPGGATEGFENTFPPSGWITSGVPPYSGHAPWTSYGDSDRVRGTGAKSARSGYISNGQITWLETTRSVGAGNLTFYAWVSSQIGDVFRLKVNGSTYFSKDGVPNVTYNIDYPANHPDTIAVGASTNFDYRADYSQYGTGLDFVAPSGGGSLGIYTTDRTGSDGYVTGGDYNSDFSGTSAACPLAAGVGALVLSKNPTITASEVRAIMRNSSEKIGAVSYIEGVNPYYGYGRINAAAALDATPPQPIPIDIGLRVYDGTAIISIACEPEGTLTSPLRIRKSEVTYGIVLVDPSDPNASKMNIQTSSGIKAVRKL